MNRSLPGHLPRTLAGALLAVVASVIVGCGGASKTHKGSEGKGTSAATRTSRQPKAAAVREFDAGLRALRLGGPEANERAAEAFERAVAADASMWEAWHDLGVVRARAGDDRAAVRAFEKAIEGNGAQRASLLARAEANRRLRRHKDARADYEAVLKGEPDDLATRLRLASLLREAGDTKGSLETVREVLRRNPDGKALADANVELGLIYLAAGRVELAELVLSKAATADAKNPRVWNALALLALKEGKDQQAFQRLDHATDLDPSFRDARFNKASVLLDAGDYAQARSELLAALKGQSEGADIDALVALGVADRGLGNLKEAKADWERVLAIVPKHADALYNLAVLEMDFLRDEARARDLLGRYLEAASEDHPRQKEARARMQELGPTSTPEPATPAPSAAKPAAKPRRRRRRRHARGLAVAAVFLLGLGSAVAAPARRPAKKPAAAAAAPKPEPVTVERADKTEKAAPKEKTFDFAAMGIEGRVLAPQLMYLLGRIKVELEKGDLEKRSFVPELVRSVDEGGL